MQSSNILKELLIDNHYITNIIIIDVLCVIAAILVVINKNPIFSVLFLISLFLGIACHLIFSGLTFIGLSYLLVYVGAVSILFLFILMLINIRVSELTTETRNTIPLTIIITLVFNYIIILLLPSRLNILYGNYSATWYKTLYNLSFSQQDVLYVSSNSWDNSLSEVSNISNLGDIMYTSYSIWLIITSIILLLSMVGAIIITIRNHKNDKF